MIPRIQVVEVLRNDPLLHTPIAGVTDAGVMAACWGSGQSIYARGLRSDGTSCVFKGALRHSNISVERVLLDPRDERFARTTDGCEVLGYEDPSFDKKTGLVYCTQAFRSNTRPGWTDTNLVAYNQEADQLGMQCLYVVGTPNQANSLHELRDPYQDINLVKEANRLRPEADDDRFLVELGAGNQLLGRASRIALARIDNTGLTSQQPYLDPQPGTWLSRHTSTVAGLKRLRDDWELLVFNGSHEVTVPGHSPVNVWNVGLGLCREDCSYAPLLWIDSKPLITPPLGVEPGPHGQQIAFGSDARVWEENDGFHLEVLYHAQDRECCKWHGIFEVVTG